MRAGRSIKPEVVQIRSPRVPAALEVVGKTMGTAAAYSCQTLDVSRSGMLLSWEKVGKIPFNVNTLVEMVIDPHGACLDKPLRCMGKVVRRESDQKGTSKTRLGVHIIQSDMEESMAWEACLNEIERYFGLDASHKAATLETKNHIKQPA